MIKNEKIAVLFSGGTDSTAAAALMLEEYESIVLLTYTHSGISNKGNAAASAAELAGKYGSGRCTHEMIDMDDLYRRITYKSYLKSVISHFSAGANG